MKASKIRTTLQNNEGTTIVEYALMLALIAAIFAGAVCTMEDITAHLGPAETMTSVP